MNFLIADSFTSSLARLTGDEQKAVKTTAFDLQMNPAKPGMSFHKLDRAKDKSFWSVRVNADIRIIVHKAESSLLLCYVDHHDKAYHWAERRKLEVHPTTGAAQLVEVRERIEEVIVPTIVAKLTSPLPAFFAKYSDEELLGWGVPPEWLADVRNADEDSLLQLADHLPAEAAEALLELATGGNPTRLTLLPAGSDPFAHPDAQRRFRLMTDVEELKLALEFPWDRWTIFLHPDQRQMVERDYSGAARVSGSAGTGKTIVALHRAVWLLKNNPESRVLLTTFSDPLANALQVKLRRLISSEPRLAERLEVQAMDTIAFRLYKNNLGAIQLAKHEQLKAAIKSAAESVSNHKFSLHFLLSEWKQVVDTWQLDSWEAYRDVKRLGRKTRLAEQQRQVLWAIFEQVQVQLNTAALTTMASLYARLINHLTQTKTKPFDFVVVDEAQDISPPQLKFLAALAGEHSNGIFLAGDLGQRIFQQAFSWKSLGVDIRGRSRTLHINYRTSHQIRMQADKLLATEISDVDGNSEDRRGTISVFNGPQPIINTYKSPEDEIKAISDWISGVCAEGVLPQEIGIFVRSEDQIDRARQAASKAGLPFKVLDEKMDISTTTASISTMHLAKGLEFRVVVVMAVDDEVIPLQARIQQVVDDTDLNEVYETERHLLYVACTRARDHLLVTSGGLPSEFLEDL